MIHDSFWGAHVSFCCEEDILESDTILINGKTRNTRHKNTLDDMMYSSHKTAPNRVKKDANALSCVKYAFNCVRALQQSLFLKGVATIVPKSAKKCKKFQKVSQST